MRRKNSLAMSAGLVLAIGSFTGPASAQQGATTEEEASVLATVTVTAQRAVENLQDVPVAVTALDTQLLEDKQVQDLLDLTAQVPNINIGTNTGTANAARIFLRGVGEDESRGAVDQAVGIYVDGVYVGRSVGSLFDVVDLASIEVLRGPQGTLYGRNTVGGAIKLTPVAPQMTNGGELRTTIGNQGRYDVRATLNLKLADSTAFRITGLKRERDGFHDIIPNGALVSQRRDGVGRLDILAFRASLLHELAPDWNLTLSYDETLDRSDPIPDSAAPGRDRDNNIFTVEPLPNATCVATSTTLGCFNRYDQRLKARGGALKIDGKVGELDVSSITGARKLDDKLVTRIGFPYTQQTDQRQFSHEVTIGQSGAGVLDWIAGVYLWNEDVTLNTVFVFPFTLTTGTNSKAVFGQASYDLTDALSVTGGLRYTNDEKTFSGRAIISGLTRQDEREFENTSFTVGADYKFTDDIMAYAKYATGFKSGGWSPDAFAPTAVFLPVDEETLNSVEAGLKADLGGVLRINSAAFFNTYEGLQIGATVPGLGFTRFNVDETEIKGVEFEWIWQLSKNFQLNGNAGWLDAKYTSVIGSQGGGLTNNGAGCPPGSIPTVPPATQQQRDAALNACALGLALKNAPELKYTVGALFTQPIGRGELAISADYSHEDGTWSLVANSPPHAFVDDINLANARIRYTSDSGWSVALWGKNLTDEEYYRATSAASFTTYAAEPLTYGIDLGYKF